MGCPSQHALGETPLPTFPAWFGKQDDGPSVSLPLSLCWLNKSRWVFFFSLLPICFLIPRPPTVILYSDNEVAGVLKTENKTPTGYFRTLIEEFSSEPKQKRESRKIELPNCNAFPQCNLFPKGCWRKGLKSSESKLGSRLAYSPPPPHCK